MVDAVGLEETVYATGIGEAAGTGNEAGTVAEGIADTAANARIDSLIGTDAVPSDTAAEYVDGAYTGLARWRSAAEPTVVGATVGLSVRRLSAQGSDRDSPGA